MCSRPVTLGGGITMEKGGRDEAGRAVNTPRAIQWAYHRSSNRDGSKAFSSSLGRVVLMGWGGMRLPGNKKSRRGTYFARGSSPPSSCALGLAGAFLLELLDTAAHDRLGDLGDDLPGDLAHHAVGHPLHHPLRDQIDRLGCQARRSVPGERRGRGSCPHRLLLRRLPGL